MMRVVRNFYRIILTAVLIGFMQHVSAQSLDEARDLYNQGGQATLEGDLETAIQNFEECVAICETLYEKEEDTDAEELMLTVQQTLPKLYWQLSQNKVKEKDYNSSLEFALKAKDAANNVSETDIASKASTMASKLYYSFALRDYKAKNYTEALTYLDNSINENPSNFSAHLLKVVIYKDTENEKALIDATQTLVAIEGDDDSKDKAVNLTANYFYNEGVKAKQASQYEKAINYIEKSFEFNAENADAYFLLVSVYNSQKDWDKAIDAANEGLKYEDNPAEAKARFYYELGNAYVGKGDNTSACDAFNKASVGVYSENANYQINEVLKCN